MHHHHHGHAPPPPGGQIRRAFAIGIALNAGFTLVEFILGYRANSVALLADATHNLSDVGSLLIAYFGGQLAERAANRQFTYGYRKASILASLLNSVLLLVLVYHLVYESIERFGQPQSTNGSLIALTAGIGIGVNLLSAWFFRKSQKGDINLRVLFAHLLVDALVSAGALISGLLIHYTSWPQIDPIVGLLIALVILLSTWKLFTASLRLSIDGIPEGVQVEQVRKTLLAIPGIEGVEHLHIWAIDSRVNALSAHLLVGEKMALEEAMRVKELARSALAKLHIEHATLELEIGKAQKCC